MPEYRRSFLPGETFFFTVVTYQRQQIFAHEESRAFLHKAWLEVQSRHPFQTVAICLLPEHLHAVWRLPEGDSDYSLRWKEIKRKFTSKYLYHFGEQLQRNESRLKQQEATIWQRRFWEHTIIDENDLYNHIHYTHFNPVKHGLVKQVSDWPWSSFHRYVKMGAYPSDWCGNGK